MAFQDKDLVCRDCSKKFTFTAGEQEFYLSRGLESEPTRCKECRLEKKRSRVGGSRIMHPTVCAQCGQDCEVPFEPRGDRPVYCNECFSKNRSSR